MADNRLFKRIVSISLVASFVVSQMTLSSFAATVVSNKKTSGTTTTIVSKNGEISDKEDSVIGPGIKIVEDIEVKDPVTGELIVVDTSGRHSADIGEAEKALLKGTKSETKAENADQETKLADNILEYSEIADLVHTYNATVLKNRHDYDKDERNDKDAKEIRDMLLDKADEYDQLAIDAEEVNAIQAASMRAQANSLRSNADDNATDMNVIKLEYEKTEKTIASNMRTTFVNYYQAKMANENAKVNTSYLEKTLASVEKKKALGMETALSVLTAKENLLKAQAELITNEEDIKALKKNLSVTCGWKYDSNAVIAELPQFDSSVIDAVDFDSDMKSMFENSYTLKLDRQKLKNVREMSNYQSIIIKYEDQLKTDENQTKLTFRGYYNSLKSAKQAYVNAVNAANLAEKNAETSEKNLGLGTVSVMDHEGVLNAFSNAKAAEKNAYFEMYKAWITYNDAVAGVI